MRTYMDEFIGFLVFGLLVAALLLIMGCSPNSFEALHTPIGVSMVPATSDQCPNGGEAVTVGSTETFICDGVSGPQGSVGNTGTAGKNGLSAAFSQTSAGTSVCPTGGVVLSFGLDDNSDGTLEPSETIEVAIVCNGSVGAVGSQGSVGLTGAAGSNAAPTPFTPVAILAPCAKNPMSPTPTELTNPDLEIFYKLENGMILDSFSETVAGYDTHFGVLSPGTYESTGAGNCIFTVSAAGVITN